jgi:hypothetical protein
LEAELNLDADSNSNPESDPELIKDPDPNLQIISDPAGSGCSTLIRIRILNTDLDKEDLIQTEIEGKQ